MTAPDDTDLLAAEYVLGTLDAVERSSVTRRAAGDPVLAQALEDWQFKLSPLSELTPEVAPPPSVFQAIEARLFGLRPGGTRQVRFWQASTAAFAALAAALVAWIVVAGGSVPALPDRLVAVLQKDPGAPAMVLDVDLKTRRLTVRSVAATTPAGKSYELWLIDPSVGAPRPLGVVPARASSETSLISYDPAVISGATYAVTLEPAGGALDGKPSGTPIMSGKLVSQP